MSDLLKEAIADAKAVRETALQNAKMALEEAFTPHLKSMLSAKLSEEDVEEGMHDEEDPRREDDDEDMDEMGSPRPSREDDDEEKDEGMHDEDDDEEEVDEGEIIEIDGVKYAPVVSEEEEDEDEKEDDMEEELDLESVIKELETEIAESENVDEELEEGDDEDKKDESIKEGEHDDDEDEKKDESVELDEEEDLEEQSKSSGIGKGTGVKMASASDEEDPGKGKVHESVEAMQTELNEYKEAVSFLREKLHEVNILNAKLLFTNRLFKEFVLSNDQKMKVVETFDRAQTTREIKLVYSTLAESFNDRETIKKNSIKESASQKTGTTAPKKKIISEEDNVANRFKKLAGILKD